MLLIVFALPSYGQDFELIKDNEGVSVREGGKKVLYYQQRPKSYEGTYERAGYIHPLYGLDEEILTEDFPEDHLHHRGIFWAWHQMLVAGEAVGDSWDCQAFHWEVVQAKGKAKKNQAILDTKVFWRPKVADQITKNIIKETTKISVYATQQEYRIIDFDIKLTSLVDQLSLGGSDDEKGYGGFSIRLKLPSDLTFLSGSGAVTPQETAVDAGAWLDFIGTFDQGRPSGLAIFSHPLNPGNPQLWILRSSGSMQNAVYPGRVPVVMPNGSSWRLRYRIVIHQKGLTAVKIEEMYQDYAKDPK